MKTPIAAALLLALTIPAHAEWFLIFDTRFCDVHDCGERQPPEDFVHSATYATRKQCLAEGRRLVADKTTAPYVFAAATSTPIGSISPRCEEGFEMSGTAAKWDCDNDITALSNRGRFYIEMGRLHEADTYPDRGSWDFRKDGSLWINGRQCKQTN